MLVVHIVSFTVSVGKKESHMQQLFLLILVGIGAAYTWYQKNYGDALKNARIKER